MEDATQVLVGTGTLYIAPAGTAFPVDPSVAPDAAFVAVGYTEEGVTLVVESSTENQQVEEELYPVDIVKTEENVRAECQLAQASLENFEFAVGGGDITTDAGPPATKTFVPQTNLDAWAVLFRGVAPPQAGTAKERDVQLTKCKSIVSVSIPQRKANKQVIALAVRAIKPDSGDPYKIIDLT